MAANIYLENDEAELPKNVWAKDEYMKEIEGVLMRYDDAKNCSFMPAAGTRMPTKYKKALVFWEWAHDYLNDEDLSHKVLLLIQAFFLVYPN